MGLFELEGLLEDRVYTVYNERTSYVRYSDVSVARRRLYVGTYNAFAACCIVHLWRAALTPLTIHANVNAANLESLNLKVIHISVECSRFRDAYGLANQLVFLKVVL